MTKKDSKFRPLPQTYQELVERLREDPPVRYMKLVPQWKTDRNSPPWDPFKDAPNSYQRYFTNINAQWMRNHLTDCFGLGGWWTENEVFIDDGEGIICTLDLRVRCTIEDHVIDKSLLGTASGTPSQYTSIGDIRKSVYTEAMSKAASGFHIGDPVYLGDISYDRWIELWKCEGVTTMEQYRRTMASSTENSYNKKETAEVKRKSNRESTQKSQVPYAKNQKYDGPDYDIPLGTDEDPFNGTSAKKPTAKPIPKSTGKQVATIKDNLFRFMVILGLKERAVQLTKESGNGGVRINDITGNQSVAKFVNICLSTLVRESDNTEIAVFDWINKYGFNETLEIATEISHDPKWTLDRATELKELIG